MYRRWTSAYQFKWTPILTYTRRHIELLQWLEANTDPVSFTETDMRRFGVALVARDLRVTVDARGMRIESGLSGVPTERLLPAVEGILNVMEPRDTVLATATVASSVEVDRGDYHEECARFAQRASGVIEVASSFRPTDSSVIADLESTDWKVQVEWGIVSKSELLARLSDPTIGRLGRTAKGPHRESVSHGVDTFVDDVPSVSVFTDMYLERRHGGDVNNVADVEDVIGVTNADAELIANALSEQYLVDTREVDRELDTGA